MRPSDSWNDDDRGAWGRPGWPYDDDRWPDERESDPSGWGFPDSRSEWTSGGSTWSEIDPEAVRGDGGSWPGGAFDDDPAVDESDNSARSEIGLERARGDGGARPGGPFDDDPAVDGRDDSASDENGRTASVPGRRDQSESPDDHEPERGGFGRPPEGGESVSGDYRAEVSGRSRERRVGVLPRDEQQRGESSGASSRAVGQSDGPHHADPFPGEERDGVAGSSDSRTTAEDHPNPLDWGGLPDEEPSGRGRRGRRSKTGRGGRRASRRDDLNGGDSAEGGGLFGGNGFGGGVADGFGDRASRGGVRSGSGGGDSGGGGAFGSGGSSVGDGFGDGGSRGRSKRRGPFSEEQSSDPEARARGICLRLLTLAPRTRAQLAEALLKREIPAEVADRVLERFSEVGLIDDQAFAAMWVSSRHHGRGLARRALAQELRHRGVEEEMVKEAVEQLDPDEEVETARRLVARKLGSTRGADPRARTRKLVGMLARKGYPAGLAFRIVREALEAEGEEASEEGGYLDSP